MAVQVASRPGQLDGCWSTWSEQAADNVIKTEFESGAVRTRRRFTGVQRAAEVSVTMSTEKWSIFNDWYTVNCQQGALATRVKTPTGLEEVWQFMAPPAYTFNVNGTFTATCKLYRGAHFP